MLKKLIACALCAAILVPGPVGSGVSAFAEEGKKELKPEEEGIDAQEALRFFDDQNVFKDQDGTPDPIRSYLYDEKTKTLTGFGRMLYRQLKADPKRTKDYKDSFEGLRKSGPMTPEQAEAMERSMAQLESRFTEDGALQEITKEISNNPIGSVMQDAILRAGFDGAVQKAQSSPNYVQVNTPDGFIFMDDEGVAVRMSKNMACRHADWGDDYEPLLMTLKKFATWKKEKQDAGEFAKWACAEVGGATTFNRELMKAQKKMNDARPSCAPKVPETGRYNFEMLLYSACRLEEQVIQLEKGAEIDRMVRIAELLGKQFHEDQFLKDDGRLKNKLLKDAAEEKLGSAKFYDEACGGMVLTVLQLVDCKIKKRKDYLAKGREILKAYQARVEGFRDRQLITDSDIQGLQADEQHVSKYITLAYLEQQRFHGLNQLERLSYEILDGDLKRVLAHTRNWYTLFLTRSEHESPDSKFLREAIEGTNWSDEKKAAYRQRARDLALRVQRLMLLYAKLEDNLLKADHVTGFGTIQAMLGATQKELQGVAFDYTIYMNSPALAKAAKKEDSGLTGWGTLKGAQLVNWVSGGKWADGYLDDRELLDFSLGEKGFTNVADMIVNGNWKGARAALIGMDPDAHRTHYRQEMAVLGDSDSQKAMAVLKKYQDAAGRVAKVHLYSGIAIHFTAWTLGTAILAPAASAMLSGAARGLSTVATALAEGGKVARFASHVLKGGAAILEHSAIRLQTLSASPDKLYAPWKWARTVEGTFVRAVNMGKRLGAFSFGLAAPLSGVMNTGMYQWDKHVGDGVSPMGSGWEAFKTGYLQGAQWATGAGEHWWTPAILFVGFSANAFEGTALAPAANSLASRGAVGNVIAGTKAVGSKVGFLKSAGQAAANSSIGKFMGKFTMESMVKAGGVRAGAATVLSMGDQIAKYMVLSQGAGKAAKFLSYRFNTIDTHNAERRIKRAQQAGMRHMQYPYWLLLPVFPAKYQQAAKEAAQTREGFKQYKDAGELDQIANSASDVTRLPLKKPVKRPFMERFFEGGWRRKAGQHGDFMVTKDVHYEAIRAELPNAIMGGKPGKNVDPMSVNPLEYFKKARTTKKMIGRLHVTDEVRDQCQSLFETAIMKKPALANQILTAKPGTRLDGFGVVRPSVQQEVARITYVNRATMPKGHVTAAQKVLGPYLETEKIVEAKARTMLDALHKHASPSKKFASLLDDIMSSTQKWKADSKGKTYMDLVAEWRAKGKAARLSKTESSVLTTTLDYIQEVQNRFQHFNTVKTASARAESALTALKTEYTGSPAPNKAVTRMLDSMMSSLRKWKGGQSGSAAVGKEFYQMVDGFKPKIQKMGKGLSSYERDILQTALAEMEGAPWMLRNSMGSSMPGWRPAQFEGFMFFLEGLMREGSSASQVIRNFLLMKTGGGKTLLAFEGLLPVAEADAAARGKKTLFLTVQSNLESQARMEFRALKKLKTNLQMDTWEGFKSKIAQGKLNYGDKADDYWILGDEMDGAALQPALTIGEQTASVGKQHTGYKLLKRLGTRLREIIRRGPGEVRKQLDIQVKKQQGLVDSMEPGSARDALKLQTDQLAQLTRNLSKLQSQTFRASKGRTDAIRRLQGQIKNIQAGPKAGRARAAELQTVLKELQGATGRTKVSQTVVRADAKMQQIWQAQQTKALTRMSGRIERLLDAQHTSLQGMKGSKAQGVSDAAGEIRDVLANRGTLSRADRALALRQFKAMRWEQHSILVQTEPAGKKLAANLRKMARRVRAQGNAAQAKKIEAQARQILEQGTQARRDIKTNTRSIIKELETGGQGWEGRVQRLIQRRDALVDRAVVKKNPIYEIFRSMRNDMYLLVHSKVRTTPTHEVLGASPNKAASTLRKAGDSLVKSAEALVRRYPTGSKGRQAKGFLKKAQAQRTQWLKQAGRIESILQTSSSGKQRALQKAQQQNFEMLEKADAQLRALRGKLEGADPGAKRALQQKVDAAQKALDGWVKSVQDTQIKLDKFQPNQIKKVQAELGKFQSQAARMGETFKSQLVGLEGTEVAALHRQAASLQRSWQSQIKRLDWTPDKAIGVMHRQINGVGTPELMFRYGLKWTGLRWTLSKVPGLGKARMLQPVTEATEGMTRTYAHKLMRAFLNDPFLPPEVRWKMFWSILPSTFKPKGSWVQTELFNLATGYTDNPGNVRIDNITGKVNAIHNGQWFESMDTPTRRYWEIEYGSDLTLPYEHKTIVTMNDFIRDNHNVRFVGFSGTAGKEFRVYVEPHNVRLVGVGSHAMKNVPMEVFTKGSGKFKAIGDGLKTIRSHDAAQVKAGKQADGLLVLSLADTRTLKSVRKYLIRTGQVKPDEIAMVFSDAELLRLNRPQAHVSDQMNLGSMTSGKIKVLMLDTRVGGRGLDLNFKGVRRGAKAGDFKGYNRFDMILVDPHLASEAHFVQVQGRIDLGRIHKGAVRNFKLVMDMPSAQKEPTFINMLRNEPLFQQMRRYPEVLKIMQAQGKHYADWAVIHTYIRQLEAKGQQPQLTQRYRAVLQKHLAKQQLEIEKSQLRSASVLRDQPMFNPLLHGLSPIRGPITPRP